MPENLRDGERRTVRSSSGRSYELYNTGGVYSCSCPAWRNQSLGIDQRTCKHLRAFRGSAAEDVRVRTSVQAAASYNAPSTPTPQRRAPLPTSLLGGQVTQNGRAARYLVPSKLATVRSKPVPPPKPAAPATAWTRLLGADPFGDDPPPPVETVLVTENEEEGESKFAVLLAESWDGVLDPTGYLMSEKLDGVRAYWDGRVFRSRLDNIFRVPEWYLQHFPKDLHLDGEFWIGRKRFQETSGFVRRHDQGTYWQQIQFRAFDLPMVQEPFSKRYDMLKAVARKYNEVKLVEHQICRGIPHLRMYLDEVEKLGGEGVMLRKANSLYVRARSDTLVKVKTFYDAEAYVTGYTAGKGKHKGRVGALECKSQRFFNDKVSLNAGVEFNLGTGLSDKDRRNPPAIGTVITYRFQDLSNKGVPQKTSYVGRRDYE